MSNWRLLIIGEKMRPIKEDELYLQELQEAIQQYNLQDKIIFTGKINDIRAVYCDLDIVVNSSIEPEPLGTTIYEGMAMKKVVIATNIGGSPEIISDGVDGYLVPHNDATKFAHTLEHCFTNFDHLVMEKSVEKVFNKFNVQTMISNYDLILSSLIRKSTTNL